MISVKHLDKYFNKGRQNEIHVIDDMTVELPEKGMTAVFGKSGCGKTTLLNVIGGLDRYSGGSVEIDGKDLKKDTDGIRNRYIGYIFQNYNLNRTRTAGENVADSLRLCGMKDAAEIDRRVRAALRNVGMENYINRTPDTLSGGQQQRIAIARAIVKNPRIILADEPTGNLDEENTVMVMDLLRDIARDHLVVLVTHEENLVDYYCDTVIELSDGRIAGTRSNEGTDGYVAKSKNDIYLGELDHRTEEGEIGIDLYGPAPAEPVRLKIVNSNGRIYLKVEEGRVQILDESSEIRLREGVFEEKARESSKSRVDMSELPPVKAEKTGRLFTFASSVKSGYSSNFKNRSRQGRVKRPMLLSVLMIFSAVMVILTAVLGTSVKKISDINRSYNHNTMYVYTEGAQREKLAAASSDPASAIDAMKPYTYPGQSTLTFDGGSFETLGVSAFSQRDVSFSADGTLLPSSLLEGKKAIAGRIDGLKAGEIVISAGMADLLLERSTYSYIKDYRDLLGLSTRVPASRSDVRLVGIADVSETAFYLNAADVAESVFSQTNIGIGRASWLKVTQPAEGEAVFFTYPYRHAGEFPEKEQYEITKSDVLAKHPTVVICGREYRVVEVVFRDEYWNRDDVASEYGYRYFYYGFLLNDSDYAAAAADVAKESDSLVYEDPGFIDNGGTSYYTMIHSTDIAATEAYIERSFEGENLRDDAVITPEIFKRQLIADERADIASRLISIGVFAAVMCVCMYFMMRSSLLGRVKEIGIYRAIGVTKRNVLFRFLIEAAVLTTLTVFVMYLLTSGALFYLQSLSKSLSKALWYPGWMAACLLVFQYALCLICGIAPVASLLRRTPAEILAKYDI